MFNIGEKIHTTPNKQQMFSTKINHRWNVSGMLKIKSVNIELLKQSIRQLLEEHEGLRHGFKGEVGAEVVQFLLPWEQIELLEHVDISSCKSLDEKINLIESMSDDFQGTLNAFDKLHKFVLFTLGDNEDARFLWIFHHSIFDASCRPIFLRELFGRYLSAVNGKVYRSPPTTSVAEWGYHYHKHMNSPERIADYHYWSSLPWDRVNSLLADFPNPDEYGCLYESPDKWNEVILRETIDREQTEFLGVDGFSVICSTFASTISKLVKNEYIHFQVFSSGREKFIKGLDITNTIGWFVDHIPLVLKVDIWTSLLEQKNKFDEHMSRIPSFGFSYNGLKHCCSNKVLQQAMRTFPSFGFEFIINYKNDVGGIAQELSGNEDLPVNLISYANENPGREYDPDNPGHELEYWPSFINIYSDDGKLVLEWKFRDNAYNTDTIQNAIKIWKNNIELLVGALRVSEDMSPA